jgi:hypothetical protein
MLLHVLTYPYARGLSSDVARHFVRSLGPHAFRADVPDTSPLGLDEADTPDPHHWGRTRRTRLIPYPWGQARRPYPSSVLRVWLLVPLLLVGCSAAV